MTVHFDLPFRLGPDGQFAVVEQNSQADIVARATAILRSRLGYRDDAPEFGIADPTFRQGGADLEAIAATLEKFDPEISRIVSRDPVLLTSIVDRVRIAEEST